MAILSSIDVPGGMAAQYDHVNEILGNAGGANLPDGLIVHICVVDGDGVHVRDVWESEEALGRFFQERLGAALAEAGVVASQSTVEPVHGSIPQGAGREANVLLEVTVDRGPELYDEITSSLASHTGGEHPCVMHFAAVAADGRMHIVDLWDSAETFGAFAASELAPAFGERLGEINPTFTPVYNLDRGPAHVAA